MHARRYCHEAPFDAMPRLHASEDGAELRLSGLAEPTHTSAMSRPPPTTTAAAAAATTGSLPRERSYQVGAAASTTAAQSQPPLRPFLLHANGKHYRMREKPLRPLLRRLLSPSRAENATIEATRVLLIDSKAMGTCGVTTLGKVLRGEL